MAQRSGESGKWVLGACIKHLGYTNQMSRIYTQGIQVFQKFFFQDKYLYTHSEHKGEEVSTILAVLGAHILLHIFNIMCACACVCTLVLFTWIRIHACSYNLRICIFWCFSCFPTIPDLPLVDRKINIAQTR